MKILLGLSPVGGHLAGIKYGLNKLGITSDLVYYKNNKYGMPSDRIIWEDGFSKVKKIISMFEFFRLANKYYDVIHFAFGSSFFMLPKHLTFLDLPFISRDIKIFTTFNGCDIRQKNIVSEIDCNSACKDKNCGIGTCGFMYDKLKLIKMEAFTKFSNKTYITTPDLKYFASKGELLFQPKHTFFDYDYIGINIKHKKIKIVHAPSDETIKGTREIIKACEMLNNEVELILVKNVANQIALNLYKDADIIIDQLKIGWYGGFAVEAMRMGKPVIAYISDTSFLYITDDVKNNLPIINANINNILEVLKIAISDRLNLKRVSEASYKYVNLYHNPIKIGEKLYRDYLG